MQTSKSITSSKVIIEAMGIKPDGVPAEKPGLCALCGLEIKKGDLCSPVVLGGSFMDVVDMADRDSDMLCGYCPATKTATGLRETGYGMFSPAMVMPFRKWGDIAHALENPPEPPFVAVFATANNQHMGWRAPVNLSRDVFYVRVGLRDLKIRRQYMLDAVEHCVTLGTALFGNRERKATAKTLLHPFVELTNDLKSPNHGALNPRILGPEFSHLKESIDFIKGLTLGETWGLRFLLTPGAGK